jgi:hypothetical protein
MLGLASHCRPSSATEICESETPLALANLVENAADPLQEYMIAAAGQRSAPYNPEKMEWALIVNTNRDAYNHSEAYTTDGLLGNIFRQPLGDILGLGRAQADARHPRDAGAHLRSLFVRCLLLANPDRRGASVGARL